MVIADFSGDFLNFEGTQDGDIVTILSEGEIKYNETLKKNMFNLSVEHNGKTKTYSPNNKAGKSLQQAFGLDSKDWINKKFQIMHLDKKMFIKPLKV